MKTDKLQDAITDIKDEFIEEAAEDNSASKAGSGYGDNAKNIRTWNVRRYWPAIAASAVILIGGGSYGLLRQLNSKSGATNSMPEFATTASSVTAAGGASDYGSSPKGDLNASSGTVNVGEYFEMAEDAEAVDGMVAAAYDRPSGDVMFSPPQTETYSADASAFVLTAGVWNDNDNWPFFTNLVNSDTISFPSYTLDPRGRIKVSVTDDAGNPLRGESVSLNDSEENTIWVARTDKEGNAYLFYPQDSVPAAISVNGESTPISVDMPVDFIESTADGADGESGQGARRAMSANEDIHLTTSPSTSVSGLQVMFVIDTTGSMSDEIAYLQKDFSSIADEAGDGISWSVNFYRDKNDEYVTKCFDFTDDVSYVQSLINDEYAEGGGDTPEAVSQILEETITLNNGWEEDASKLLFLVFDAPPHDDDDVYKVEDAVRLAAEQGIRIVPVVASNAERGTEVFGRALSIMTGSDYVFLTDDSGVGESHLEPIIGDYDVELLHDIIVRIINEAR